MLMIYQREGCPLTPKAKGLLTESVPSGAGDWTLQFCNLFIESTDEGLYCHSVFAWSYNLLTSKWLKR